ncbi:MAG TPA: AMP-binding protein, partial [Acidobacteriota bacterium]|nr:AMP-binding protein [Acidobacteriota bacterium]
MSLDRARMVHGFLEDSARRFPAKSALFASGKWHSYRELDDEANRLARFLLKQGLAKGDRVALLIENSAEYVVSYYAILKAGGTTVALNTESTADDVSYVVGDCGIRYLVAAQRLLARLGQVPGGRPAWPVLDRSGSLKGVFA